MFDDAFINSIQEKAKQAEEKVRSSFSNLSSAPLNWKPSPEKWSIAQCFDHLVTADGTYLPILKKIAEGSHKMNFWERYSPFTNYFGRMFKKTLTENVRKKYKSPKPFVPSKSEVSGDIIDQYLDNLRTFMDCVVRCNSIDLDKTKFSAPIMGLVTFNVRDGITFMIQHDHRHINQAIRVKESEGFPNS